MMCQYAVLHLDEQLVGEVRDLRRFFSHHLGAHDDVPQELSIIRVIIGREGRELLHLSDVMAHGCRKKKVSFQDGICRAIIITELCHAQGMLQKTADKSMMNGLRRRGILKGFYKALILYKKAFQELF